MNVEFTTLSLGTQIGLVVVGTIQIVLLIIAIVVNLRTEEERLTLPRVAWLAITILFSFVGPVLFLLGGRKKVEQISTDGASHETVRSTIDELYK